MKKWIVRISMVFALALMLSVKGVAIQLAGSGSVQIQDALFSRVSEASLGPIPASFFLYILLVIAVDYVLLKTQFGRNLFAVGGSEEVAAACGINAKWLTLIAMTLSAAVTGLGGVLLTTRLYSANGNMGTSTVMTCESLACPRCFTCVWRTIPVCGFIRRGLPSARNGEFSLLAIIIILSTQLCRRRISSRRWRSLGKPFPLCGRGRVNGFPCLAVLYCGNLYYSRTQ